MSTRTFWYLVLKTLGMWLIINALISLPAMINSVLDILANPFSWTSITVGIAYLLLLIVFYFLILQFLILRSQWTIDFLKLEKRFEVSSINLPMPYSRLLKIIIILIGGILFARAIPHLAENLYLFTTDDSDFSQNPKTIDLIIYSAQAIISLLIMTNSEMLQRYMNEKNEEAESKQAV